MKYSQEFIKKCRFNNKSIELQQKKLYEKVDVIIEFKNIYNNLIVSLNHINTPPCWRPTETDKDRKLRIKEAQEKVNKYLIKHPFLNCVFQEL